MHARSLWAFLAILGAAAGPWTWTTNKSSAQEAGAPSDWSTKSAVEVAAVGADPTALAALSSDEATALRARAKELLLSSEVVASENYYQLTYLLELAKSNLSDDELASLDQLIAARAEPPDTTPFIDVIHKSEYMQRRGESLEQRQARIVQWVMSHDSLDPTANLAAADANLDMYIYQVFWSLEQLNAPVVDPMHFTAEWNGFIKAPVAGEFRFSTHEIDSSYENPQETDSFVRNTLSVQVGDREVLKAEPGQWRQEGPAVPLEANQPVPIRVVYMHHRYDAAAKSSGNECPVALLKWEGPGISATIVPPGAFLQNADGAGGLTGTFRSGEQGSQIEQTSVEPQIANVWLSGRSVCTKYPEAVDRIVADMWEKYSAPAFIERCANEGLVHPLLIVEAFVEALSPEQRQEVLGWIRDRPELLTPLSWTEAWRMYVNYRYDSADDAIAALGRWGFAHPFVHPVLDRDFYAANQLPFRLLAEDVAYQFPDHLQTLLEDYLVTEQGGCSLHVAYALSYAHQMRGEMDAWVALLNEKLADEALPADVRASWLLARAQAAELEGAPDGRHAWRSERLLAGLGWIDEVSLTANSAEPQLCAIGERLAQRAALGQFEMCQEELDRARAQGGEIAGDARIADWKVKIDALRDAAAADRTRQATAARDAYLRELKRRQQQASDGGSDADAARLGQLISQVESAAADTSQGNE